MTLKEEIAKRLVLTIWEREVRDTVMIKLKLKRTPIIEFDDIQNAIMYTEYICSIRRSDKVIISTEPTYKIQVNIKNMLMCIHDYKRKIANPFCDVDKIIIKQMLLHESRHIWQAENGFYDGICTNDKIDISEYGYGSLREEKDANDWAIQQATNDKELAVFELQKFTQEQVGKGIRNFDIEDEYMKSVLKAHYK